MTNAYSSKACAASSSSIMARSFAFSSAVVFPERYLSISEWNLSVSIFCGCAIYIHRIHKTLQENWKSYKILLNLRLPPASETTDEHIHPAQSDCRIRIAYQEARASECSSLPRAMTSAQSNWDCSGSGRACLRLIGISWDRVLRMKIARMEHWNWLTHRMVSCFRLSSGRKEVGAATWQRL